MLLQYHIPYDPYNNPLNNNEWSFPLLEIVHIVGFAVAIGSIFLQDLRMLGVGLRRQSPSELRKDFAPWTLRGSSLTYPIIMTGHLTGMGLFGGMIAITDARLLGLAMRKYPIADVVNQLRLWKRIGGVLTMSCGAMLWASKAEFYYYNPYLW